MNWAQSGLLWLCLLIPGVVVACVWAWRSRKRAILAFASLPAWSALVSPRADRSRVWQLVLCPMAFAGLAVALAGPQYGFEWIQRKAEGVSLVVVLDVSASMDAQDVSPSRIERARREVSDFLDQLRGDTVGLVLFANGAFVRLPVTADYDTVRWALGETNTHTIAAQGSSISGALDTAVQMLSRAEGSGRGVVLVSDGEFHDAEGALEASVQRLVEAKVPIFAIGVGDPAGAPLPLPEGGFKKDRAGNMVLSKLDEPKLRELALATGGAYVRAVVGVGDSEMMYRDQIRAKLVAEDREVSREKKWHERYQIPLALAFAALVVQASLGIGPRARRAVRAAAVLLALGLVSHPAAAGSRAEGLAAAEQEKWTEAVELLGRARVENPNDAEVGVALGRALYERGRFREAQDVFDSLAATDPDHEALHRYNAGHAAYADGRLDEAANQFQAAAKADPSLAGAPKNEQAVRKEIKLRQQLAEQSQQQSDSQGEAGESQDGDESGNNAPPQSGEPSGEPSENAQPQAGENPGQEPGKKPSQPPAGQPEPGNEGDTTAEGSEGQPGELLQEEEGGQPVDVASGEGTSTMSKADAARLVDGVKDGHPRLRVGGQDTEKDW